MFTFYGKNLITSTAEISLYEDEPLSLTSGYSFTSLIDRRPKNLFEWSAGTGTTTSLHVTMNAETVDTIILQNINFSEFEIQINGGAITPIGADTSTAHWDSWTDTNFYMQIATTTVNTIDILVYTTTSGGERECGQLIVCAEEYELEKNPTYDGYKPIISGNRIEKIMADGGVVNYKIGEKFQAKIFLDLVTESERSALYSLYETSSTFYFLPFPTTSSWNGEAYEIVFGNEFTLNQRAVNDITVPYFKGEFIIKETPGK